MSPFAPKLIRASIHLTHHSSEPGLFRLFGRRNVSRAGSLSSVVRHHMSIHTPVALPWYNTEGDYLDVLNMLPAAERQDPFTYDVFMANIKTQHEAFKRRGLISICVPVDAAAVKRWCDDNNMPFCRQSITAFICAIAATDNNDILVAEEKSVAGRTGRNAEPLEFLF